jgi:hypothetical protein
MSSASIGRPLYDFPAGARVRKDPSTQWDSRVGTVVRETVGEPSNPRTDVRPRVGVLFDSDASHIIEFSGDYPLFIEEVPT